MPLPGTSRQTLTRLRSMSEWYLERRHPQGALIDVSNEYLNFPYGTFSAIKAGCK